MTRRRSSPLRRVLNALGMLLAVGLFLAAVAGFGELLLAVGR